MTLVGPDNDGQAGDLMGEALRHPSLVQGIEVEGHGAASWAELVARSCSASGWLQGQGVGFGDRVLIALPTSLDFFVAFLATRLAGAVPVPVPAPTGALASTVAERIQGIADVTNAVGILVAPGAPALKGHTRSCPFDSASMSAPALFSPQAPAPHDTAFVQFTSGSTGRPKGVVIPQGALQAQLAQLRVAMQIRSDDVVVSWLPPFHDMGLVGGLLLPFVFGLQLTLLSPLSFVLRPARWLQIIARTRATLSAAPSSAFSLCAARIKDAEVAGLDLSSWRIALDGAEAVRIEAIDAFNARFAALGFSPQAILPAYGLAESTLAVTMTPAGRGPRLLRVAKDELERSRIVDSNDEGNSTVLVSSGVPVPGAQVRIVDDAGRELPERRVGHIEVRSPACASGYLNNDEATRETFGDGALRTGDVGAVVDGELYVVGRTKDILVIRGRKVSAEDVEAAVEAALMTPAHRPPVCLVFALPSHPIEGERAVALVGVHGKGGLDDEARARAAAAAADVLNAKVELQVVPSSCLPRTTSGKLRRTEARRLWEAGLLLGPAAPLLEDA